MSHYITQVPKNNSLPRGDTPSRAPALEPAVQQFIRRMVEVRLLELERRRSVRHRLSKT